MEEAIAYAKKYIEDVLSFFGLNCDVYATHEDEVIELSVPSTYLNGFLIGQHGETMRALQSLVSSALKNKEFEFYRVNLDIADYKKQRQDRLAKEAEEWIREVIKSGQPKSLPPMNAADRRVIHKAVSDSTSVTSESEGEGRDRHIVLKLADQAELEEAPEESTEEPSSTDK